MRMGFGFPDKDVASKEFGTYDGFPAWLVEKLRWVQLIIFLN